MKKLMQSLTGSYASNASVVDGTLILSLPDAITPVVWRMELGHVKSSAMEVRENDDKTCTLFLKTPRGDMNDIAPFSSKAQAVRALMAVSHAMERAHGQVLPAGKVTAATVANDGKNTTVATRSERKGKMLTSLIAVAALIVLIVVFVNMGPRAVSMDGAAASTRTASEAGSAAGRAGVPVSADDFLRGR